MDEVVRSVSKDKADKKDFEKLEKSLAKGRAEAVFNDMKDLFDTTVKQFDEKVVYERKYVAQTYDRILSKQENMFRAYEMKYSNLLKARIERVESFMEDIAAE